MTYGQLIKMLEVLGYTPGAGGVTDHGALTGLGDDDHTQYHNDARALTWLGTRSTTDLPEGTNLYYTNERVDDRAAALIQNGAGISWTYDDNLGTLTPAVSLSAFDTDDLAEGSSNLYFTDERAQDAVGNIFTDGSTINFTYNDGGPSITAEVIESALNLANIGGQVTDAQVPNTITLDNITQITARSHTSLSDIGTNTHAQIDTHIASTSNPHSTTLEQVRSQNNQISGDIDANTNKITNLATPTNAADAVRKDYVDNLLDGLKWKTVVQVATTANITLSGEQTIDGVLTSGSRVLVKNQTDQTENGIYVSAAGAWSRSTDANTGTELVGAAVNVLQGTTNGDTEFVCTNDSITLGSTNVVFVSRASATNHNNLSGLQGGTTDQYYHLTSAQQTLVSGITASAAELNIMDGVTATTTEINYLSGVTSSVQTQLNAKQALDATLTALAAYNTNGLIAQTAADTFAGRTITGTTNQISVANGDGVSGNPTLSLPSDVIIPTVLTVPNTGLHLLDTNASHDLIIKPGSNITADRTLTVTTGDADRTFDISAASVTVSAFGATIVDDADAAAARTTLGLGTIATQNSNNVSITGGSITGMPTPSADTDVAIKSYVDGQKDLVAVDLATTANITTLSGSLTVDGVTTTSGVTRVLVKNQSTPANNGLYLANSSAWTRLVESSTIAEVLKKGVIVTGGITNRGKQFYSSYNDAVTLGTDPIRYQEVPYDRARKEFWEAVAIASAGGGYLCTDGAGSIYMLRLTNPGQLKRYSVTTNTWTDLTGPGVTMASCSKITFGLNSIGDDAIFVGNSAGVLYVYSIPDDAWSTLATATTAFITLEWDGNDQLFAARGAGTTTWYKYVISTNTWSTVTAIPAGAGSGADSCWDGSDSIYFQLGNSGVGFYRYSISGDSWTQLSSQPNAIGAGGSITYLNGCVYCFRGATTTEQFRYYIKSNTWITLTTPSDEFGIDTLSAGSDTVADASRNFIFATRATGTTPFYRKTAPYFDSIHMSNDVGIHTNDPQAELDVNGYFRWIGHVRSTVDLNKNNNTTLSDHTQIRVWLNASKTYTFRVVVFTTSNVAGGVKVAMGNLLGLTASNIIYEVLITDAGATTQGRLTGFGTGVGVTAVTNAFIVIQGLITTSASGLLTLQYAQNAATGSNSTFKIGSHMEVKEVA